MSEGLRGLKEALHCFREGIQREMADLVGWLGWLIPSGSLIALWQYLRRRRLAKRECRVLNVLEGHAGQALSVDFIHKEFIAHVLRDVKLADIALSLKPGGDPANENDLTPPATPWRIKLRHFWRVRIMRELPSEDDVREILRALQEKRLVRFVGGSGPQSQDHFSAAIS